MGLEQELIDLERAGWEALSAGADAAGEFYGDVLASQVLMLLPGGMVIADRAEAIQSMQGAPWDGVDVSQERVHRLSDDCVAVTYRASATRGDNEYNALFNSTYVLEGGRWRLALHQQTPV